MQASGFKLMPDHYFRLRPFLRLFETGWPVLLYHKLGGMAVLEDFDCKAIQFLVSGRIGKTNDWDATGEPDLYRLRRIMAYRSLRELLASAIFSRSE